MSIDEKPGSHRLVVGVDGSEGRVGRWTGWPGSRHGPGSRWWRSTS